MLYNNQNIWETQQQNARGLTSQPRGAYDFGWGADIEQYFHNLNLIKSVACEIDIFARNTCCVITH